MEDWITVEILEDFGIQQVNKQIVVITLNFDEAVIFENCSITILNNTSSLFIFLK